MDVPERIDLEAEYNNRARVPEHPEILESWMNDASSFRSIWPHEADLAYSDAPRTTYDLFHAAPGATSKPRTALFIHGGYWQSLDKSRFSHVARGLCLRGYDVALANYTLCPQTTLSGICTEMRLLAAHLVRSWGKPLLVYGHSAGGHLTANLMTTDWTGLGLPGGIADRGMPISGLFDLRPLLETSVNGKLNLDRNEAAQLSPILREAPASGRMVAVVGGAESAEYIRQSRDFAGHWRDHGLKASLNIQEGKNHFTVIAPLAEPDSSLITQLDALGCENL
ncbi:alpha/beta hydrolase [Roseibium sp. RKSG952]|uniref:alpha/beta hydrolase n=1 Tax=Roseibium sp. RKSG952 TaxID=2529384 RepID=UPI0012BB65E8|nr:alpha/beta hydrolase [Roseibium sp. RKSG952]MTH98948.1 alpha/beta hydrolase [Roseibium sp. RKSG952]